MRLTHLFITDFRSLARVEIDLRDAHVLCLFGLNGQGKTSVLAAIQYALFGCCEFTDARGAGRVELIKDGAKRAEIDLTIDTSALGLVRIVCAIPRRGASTWQAVNAATGEVIADDRDALWYGLGLNKRHAQVCAMPAAMVESKAMSDVLADFMSGGIDPAEIAAMCDPHTEWLQSLARRRALPLQSVADYEAIGKVAYELRRDMAQQIRDAEHESEIFGPTRQPVDLRGRPVTVDQISSVEAGIARIEAALSELQRELGQCEAAAPAGDVEALVQAVERAKEDACASTIVHDAAREKLREATDTEMLAQTQHATHQQQAAAIIERVNMATAALASVQGPDRCCPTCRRPMEGADLEPLRATLTAANAERDASAERGKALLDALGRARAESKAAAAACETTGAALRVTETALRDAQIALDAARNAPARRTVAEVQGEIDAQAQALERGRSLLTDLHALKERNAAVARLESARAEHARLDWAVKAFKDGEILKGAVRPGLDDLVSRVNVELQPLGYGLGARVDGKAIELMLSCPGKSERPVGLCSQGQRALAQWAVAMAFADTGAPVLIDDANHWDGVLRGHVLRALRERATGTVVVAGAWQQSREAFAAAAGALAPAVVVWVDSGAAVVEVAA